MSKRQYLAFIRCGATHQLIDDDGERNFDIALNLYAKPKESTLSDCEYLIVGGLNKYKAAFQFINNDILTGYKGFIFLDDDLEMTYSSLSSFLYYCTENILTFAQPSLTSDSYFSHSHLVNISDHGWRPVDMIEVMCPFFSFEALKSAIVSFDLSYSTWGLDYIWPKMLNTVPVVVDEFTIRHTKPVNSNSEFYTYMKKLGISPTEESNKLKHFSLEKLRPN